MAILYQDIEDNILAKARGKWTDLNFDVETWIFDGCLILLNNITKEDSIKVRDYFFEKQIIKLILKLK
jgi:hypothetical protein